jgi:hypothetical protein
MNKSNLKEQLTYLPTVMFLIPYSDDYGKTFRTGLNDKDRQRLEALTGLNLKPNSPYYYHNDLTRAVRIENKELLLSDSPTDEIIEHWLNVHPSRSSFNIIKR